MTPLESARALDQSGLNVLPARAGSKAPSIDWKPFQTQRSSDRLAQWFGSATPRNFWIATGTISGVVVLDTDDPNAETYWREKHGLAELLDQTTCVPTSKGFHYYFRIGPTDKIASWSSHPTEANPDAPSFDVRAEGTGVIGPGSVHETGHRYEFLRDMSHIQPLPGALRGPEGSRKGSGEPGTGTPAGAGSATGGGEQRSHLAKLLSSPGRNGRNNWLTAVAGHYAKQFHGMRDAYETHVRIANGLLAGHKDGPLDDAEFSKTLESIWKTEQETNAHREAGPETGWLIAGDHCLLTQTAVKDDEGKREYGLAEWGDFDVRALGVVEDDDAARVYDVQVLRKRKRDAISGLLPARVLADQRQLSGWLAEFGVSVIPPDNAFPKSGTVNARLARYLEAQDPPRFKVVDALGWDAGNEGFITHEGVIRPDGMHGFAGVRPHPKLREWAPYSYGLGDEQMAQAVLREVLTFHDETVCAVFGAWWAACLLKPQVHEASSLFPFMALEAPSESGKTTGFFSLMLQLNGNTQGQVNPTRAALRDSISGNHSGIVWIDDLDDAALVHELLRHATGEGSVSKKSEDRTGQTVAKLVAPICLSGESVGLQGQKALLDRAVLVRVGSPTSRMSLHDPARPQWDDIVALRKRFPESEGGLTQVAGNMVSLALRHQQVMLESIRDLRPGAGRWSDKIGILRAGARLLDAMTGEQKWAGIVDTWASQQIDLGSENTLTLSMIPNALQAHGWPSQPVPADNPRAVTTPAFVYADEHVWFSPTLLAKWWAKDQNGRVQSRTETAQALSDQARTLNLGGQRGVDRKQFQLLGTRTKMSYWRLTPELSAAVLARSRDEVSPGVSQRVERMGIAAPQEPLALPAQQPGAEPLGLPLWRSLDDALLGE